MITKKLTIMIILCSSIILSNDYNKDYEQYKKDEKKLENQYTTSLNKSILSYKLSYKKSFNEYKKTLSREWGEDEVKISDKVNFVQYSQDIKQREIIDYKNGQIKLEVLADDDFAIDDKFQKMWDDVKNQKLYQAFDKDPIDKSSYKDIFQKNTRDEYKRNEYSLIPNKKLPNKIQKKQIKSRFVNIKNKRKKIFYVNIPLPKNHIRKRAEKYKHLVQKYSSEFNVQSSTIFAIMQTESYFNPMARSHIPAFGLMQIVPSTAGKDAYRSLYNQDRKLSSYYLYSPKNNIKLGVKYIQIIQQKYLRGIRNKKKLLYATAIAYNAGIGSLIYSLTGTRVNGRNYSTLRTQAIRKINNMSARSLYNHFRSSRYLTKEAHNYVAHIAKRKNNYLAWDVA